MRASTSVLYASYLLRMYYVYMQCMCMRGCKQTHTFAIKTLITCHTKRFKTINIVSHIKIYTSIRSIAIKNVTANNLN